MTREEAIKIIDCYDIGFYDLSGEKIPADKLADAFDMAIEALSAKPQTDLISRADALRELNGACSNWEDDAKVAEIINALPSADADRPHGEWIKKYNGNGWNDFWDYTCSNCGKKYKRADAVLYHANYCPNCGARMKGGDDE